MSELGLNLRQGGGLTKQNVLEGVTRIIVKVNGSGWSIPAELILCRHWP